MVLFQCDPEVRQEVLAAILGQDQFHDVDLVAQGGIRFSSHRLILGSSAQVFHDILVDDQGIHAQEIHLPDFRPSQLKELLDFVYGRAREPLTSDLGRFLALNRKVALQGGGSRKRKRLEGLDKSLIASQKFHKLLVNSYATLNVEASSPLTLVDFESQCQSLETEAAFRALIGLRQLSDGSFEGQAMAYSQPKAQKMASQFDEVSLAIREVTGFSAGHWLFQSHYFTRQGLKVPKVVESLKAGLKERMEPFTNEQVEKILSGDQIQSVIKSGKSRGLPELEKLSVISVSMTDDIPFDHLDDVVFVYFHSSSKKIFFKQIEVQEKDVNQTAELWARTLLDVWANSSNSKIPKSQFLIERFHSVSESMIVFSAAQGLLESREVRCPDCGEVFSLTTSKEREAFQDHTRNHQVEKFKCECDVVLTSNVDKIKHIQLAHSNGKFLKCEDCEFIGIEAEVTEHRTKQHQTFICDVCATVSKNLAKHKNHVKKHVPIKCKDCPEEFIGKANLLEHRTKVHGDRFPCKWCGKVFSATWKLKTHITGAHATPRFMCDLCGQEFRLKTTMYRHKISVHIKNRPFVCRYGCGADYNDECNLRTHEKKTHGGAFQGASFNHIYKNL
ncbi:hypothetical protein TCAL_05037 [Tigriopus californicus]|uniref:BTB domain-containing protein n=1 Tax=Tigriopus californicus TaxID=6832 RepID=A0A553P7B8_TIGCA|nr:hypothetical protein TCAL_05037 [Tigriopus californicus]